MKETPSHTELNKRIFENKDTAQAEDALRSILKETQVIQNSKSGKSTESLNQSKGKLEQCCKNSFVLPAHKDQVYSSRLEALRGYLEAITLGPQTKPGSEEAKDSETENEQQDKVCLLYEVI